MSKPIVAIVGRPNVGKSTLFNVLAGSKISIVKDTPGVTRDRIYADVSWLNYNFTLIDTGGIEPDSKDIILSQMREQAEIAIATADVIMFMTDVRQGLVYSDSKVADMLRRSGKPVVLVVNKVDNFDKMMADVYEFYNLGIGDPFPISSVGKLGLGDMLDEVVSHFDESALEDALDDRPRIAIVGKPNVGKSSIINKLTGRKSTVTGDRPGVTKGKQWVRLKGNLELLDTPGILWPKFEDQDLALNLAFCRAIKDQKLDVETLALRLIGKLMEIEPEKLKARYKLEELGDRDIETMDMIGRKRGFIMGNKELDYTRIATTVLN